MNYKNLALEGGVVLGIAYGGALRKLQELGILQNIKRVSGTSAGAITAVLLANGHSAEKISNIISKETDFGSFIDDNLFQKIGGFTKKYGLHNGDKIEDWVRNYIGDITFREHQERVNASQRNYRELYLTGTNVNTKSTEIYSYRTTPHKKIVDAVRISMSVPFYFEAVLEEGQVKVDGGCLWNYPVGIFDHIAFDPVRENTAKPGYNSSENFVFNKETLGFRLGARDEELYLNRTRKNPVEINNIKDYTFALVSMFQETANKLHLHENDYNRTVFIDTKDVDAFNFDLTDEDKDKLILSGYECVGKFLQRQKLKNENESLKKKVAELEEKIKVLTK